MKKQVVLVLGFIISIFSLSAQQNPKAVAVLDEAHAAYEKAGGISADFTVKVTNNKAKQNESYSGKVLMKSNKFKYTSEEVEMWFDGKNQWVLNKESDEVNLSTPTASELEAINPSVLFQIYKRGYTCKYSGEKKVGGKSVEVVDLVPVNTKKEIEKITVQIDKNQHTLTSIFIQNKNQSSQLITIKNYKSGLNHADNLFVFNKKQYPKAEVIDLR
jgi:Outer membrane lipoprotein-sorting protein